MTKSGFIGGVTLSLFEALPLSISAQVKWTRTHDSFSCYVCYTKEEAGTKVSCSSQRTVTFTELENAISSSYFDDFANHMLSELFKA